MSDSHAVRRRFDAAAGSYDRHAAVQLDVARDLIALAELPVPGRIFEAGCGSGLYTELLATRWPQAVLEAIDLSPAMAAETARRLGARANVSACDLRSLEPQGNFDLVTSNAALHWLVPLAPGLARLLACVRPGGHALFSIMLDGTLAELHGLRAELMADVPVAARMPVQAEIVSCVRASGFAVLADETRSYTKRARSARDLLRLLHEQGLTGGPLATGRRLLTRGELARLIAEYDRRHGTSDGVPATYRVGFVLAQRSAS